MSKKTLNVDAITNELQGSSLFFTKPDYSPAPAPTNNTKTNSRTISAKTDIENPEPAKIKPIQTSDVFETSTENANERLNERPVEVSNDRTTEVSKDRKTDRSNVISNDKSIDVKIERSKKRQTERHTFEIYGDQLLALKEIALNREKITGEKVLMGDLSKEAFDLLISREKL